MPLQICIVTSSKEMEQALAVREEVFILEQGVAAEIERDAYDKDATHFIAQLNQQYIATARFRKHTEQEAKLERMAVLKPYRNGGIGTSLVQAMETEAVRQGYTCMILHAQKHAQSFYQRLGYTPLGEPFTEAGIEHVTMTKKMTAPAAP